MAAKDHKKRTTAGARPIKSERDYRGAAAVAKKILKQTNRESAAERRLQALIEEMEKFEELDDEAVSGDSAEDIYKGPRRRWSDDTSDPE